jgi:hydrazine synthase alpha subunit-like protein/F5/8 type C domain-containing protein
MRSGETLLRSTTIILLLGTVAWGGKPAGVATVPRDKAVRTEVQIEADWLRQAEVRAIPVVQQGTVTPEQDAGGACDGLRTGRWGFHTDLEENPWWQVDLGKAVPLDEVMIYNRCDGSQERAFNLIVLTSVDGKEFTEAYRHAGTPFYGRPDNRPLVVNFTGRKARYVRVQLPGKTYLHLDEVEVYQYRGHNIALRKPATQSSVSRWSNREGVRPVEKQKFPVLTAVERGLKLAASLRRLGTDVDAEVRELGKISESFEKLPADAASEKREALYLDAQRAIRRMTLSNPLLDFDDLLLVKRVPAWFKVSRESRTYTHMSDQYYGWFSRPGGGLYILEDFKSDNPQLRSLTDHLPPGNIIRPEISYDGKKVLFAHCKHYPELTDKLNKLDKSTIPEDAFYHLYEMNLNGSGFRRLTRGKYDDFDGRYLPNGEIVFLSTRRGQYIQCDKTSGCASMDGELPDSYVRCGGDEYRPVAVYTLHVMDADGQDLRQISPFENFEWTPSIDHQGRILYARWDYVDRNAMPFMSLWATMPDGTSAQAIFGNYTRKPHAIFEPRAIPGSDKFIFTASAHHSNTAGSLVLLDLNKGSDGEGPMTRLTPEVPFPEVEAWPSTYYVNPYPLSEEHYLVSWSDTPLVQTGLPAGAAALGVYLFDAFGNLNLVYRDPEISSMYPIPVRSRPRPPAMSSPIDWEAPKEGRMLVLDVNEGLEKLPPNSVRSLRIVGVPAKDHPVMNRPVLGFVNDDPGKFVMGTVPVEKDGSAYFRVPSGVSFFMQALDDEGRALQTMRSVTYVQPGQDYTCVGCHEPRNTAPPNSIPLAVAREPSKITPGVKGSWPLDYQVLMQPVIDKHCVECHRPDTEGAKFDLTAEKSYQTLGHYGEPSLAAHVVTRYRQGRSTPGECIAQTSPIVKLLESGHHDVELSPNDWERLNTWLDTYGHRLGSFSKAQEERLIRLRESMAAMLEK